MLALDRAAALSLAGDQAFDELQGIYQSNERLRVPDHIGQQEAMQ
jgi:hypothetical protein